MEQLGSHWTDILEISYLSIFRKSVEKIKRRNTFLFQKLLFKNRTVYDIILKNMLQPDRPQREIQLMPVACWIRKATATLEPKLTQQSKPTFVWAYIARQVWLLLIRHVCPNC
jgi:hypothetical protein